LEVVLGGQGHLERLAFEIDDRAPPLRHHHPVAAERIREEQHHDGQRGQREEEAPGHPTASTRKPTPRSAVITIPPSSLRRTAATCASSVLVGPNHCPPHTCSIRPERRRPAPGSPHKNARTSNSLVVRCTSRPSRNT